MFSFIKRKHILLIYIFISILLIGCQLQRNEDTHGINFLKNRADQLVLNKSNINDVINVLGYPHTESIYQKNRIMYFERKIITRNPVTFGSKRIKDNNVLVLDFDNMGILKDLKFYKKKDMKRIEYLSKQTNTAIGEKSFVNKFLESVRYKMYNKK